MLVPSEDSNMESERLASAHRTEGVRSALSATAASRPAMMGFNMNSLSGDSRTGVDRDVVLCLTWRNAHHLQFIRAFDATSRRNCALVDACRHPISTCLSPLMCCS